MDEDQEKLGEALDGVIVQHKADQAYDLKLAGASLAEIADELGYSSPAEVSTAIRKRFEWEAREITSLERESALALELLRLDKLQKGLWQSAVYGDPKSVSEVLKIMTLRGKYLGFDQPDADTHQTTVLIVGGDEESYVEKLKQLQVEDSRPVAEDGE